MGKKIRKNIYIDEEIWEMLPSYIDTSRSSFFEKQARRQINCNDKVEEINLKLDAIETKKNDLLVEEKLLKEKRDHILKTREMNKNNFELREKAMSIIRNVVNNQGAIERRQIKLIAKNHVLEPDILIEQAETEQLRIID